MMLLAKWLLMVRPKTRCHNLQAVLLGGVYKITDYALIQLVRRLSTKLQAISLAGCEKITSASVAAIAQHCSNLRVVNLSDCKNVCPFPNCCPFGSDAQKLSRWSQVNNEALTLLMRNCRSLAKLNLSRCKDVKSEVLQAAANCSELQQLVLSWCPRLTASAVVQLGELYPSHPFRCLCLFIRFHPLNT